MRISIIGQSAFGKSVLETLAVNDVDDIVGVFAPPTREGRPADPISEAANALNVPVFGFKRLRDQEAVTQFKSLEPELCIMAFVTDIVPMEMINSPILGTIQYHPSLLPLHRGPSSINWPIINGESKTGLTIFWPDNGLDTGPVLIQKEVEITPEDTLGDLYFKKLFPLGVEAIIESVELVRSGKAPKAVQDESMATYEGWCKADDVQVDWGESTNTIFNMIRGADPQPGANTTFKGAKLSLYDATASSGNRATPGTVLSIDEFGIDVSTSDGNISIGRVRESGSGKVLSAKWAESVRLGVGDVLGI
ncbi:MAG TPA: methionyl-tRNA formyltransferase [Acidobacteria bacterium]|nr:methionyl-tRNA formyltransferase [Acidobacteriota bacterium]|tara:strand:- start:51 stop:971 length:921 start_codon:yes stop_codon:yes gene_type:complete